jgi:hypothetical protein
MDKSTAHVFQTKRADWEKYSAIRNKPGYVLSEPEEGQYYFPLARQPLCFHELVKSRGNSTIEYLLIQSLYRNLNEIADIETGIIYECAIAVASNKNFPSEITMDAFTVAIDEVYHAYLATDLIQQLSTKTGILPLKLPTTQLELAMLQTKRIIPPSLHKDFELIAVSITESLIGSEAGNLAREEGLHKTVKEFTYDHMVDEVRHSRIFNMILRTHWSNMSSSNQEIISKVLPNFISSIFQQESQKLFDKALLIAIGFSEDEIDHIIRETYMESESAFVKRDQKAIDNILKFLDECEVFM